MPTTPIYGLTTPVLADENNVPADLASLATQIENVLAAAVRVETLGVSLATSSWDRVAGYGTSLIRQGRVYTLTVGIRQVSGSPLAQVLTIPVSAAPGVNVGLVCATNATTGGLLVVAPDGTVNMGASYGPAKPANTIWIGSTSWVK